MKLKKIIRLLSFLLLLYLVLHIIVYAIQERFIFLEKELHADHNFNFKPDFEEFFLPMDNSDQINALFFKTKQIRKGSILYFHGNADNLERWGNYADYFTNQGYDILMIDYRGYGKSDGIPSETNLYEDGQKAYDWLRQKTLADSITIYGRSLGSGVASHIAANNPAKRLILETPFNNMKAVIETRYPFVFLKFPLRHQFPNDENLHKVVYPVYIFHGTKDKVVPLSCAEKLKKVLKPSDQFFIIENGGHKNLSDFPTFNQSMKELLNK